MEPGDLRSYSARNWKGIRALKDRTWIEAKRRMSPLQALASAEALRQQTLELRPDWPSPEERRRDLENHARLSRLLQSVRR